MHPATAAVPAPPRLMTALPTPPRLHPCGTGALLMDVAHGHFDMDAQKRLWALCREDGELQRLAGVREVVLGVNNVLVTFDPLDTDLPALEESLRQAWAAARPWEGQGRLVEVPVVYHRSPEFDLHTVAGHAGLELEEVIELHTATEYRVACVGWVPGFVYLVGLPQALWTPRRATPRTRVQAGSVGIGGSQTGIIPAELPSGWNMLGLTELDMFDPHRAQPALFAPGDRVRFVQRGRLA